jgi:hypothetical protein
MGRIAYTLQDGPLPRGRTAGVYRLFRRLWLHPTLHRDGASFAIKEGHRDGLETQMPRNRTTERPTLYAEACGIGAHVVGPTALSHHRALHTVGERTEELRQP